MNDHRLRWALLCVAASYGAFGACSAQASRTVTIKPGDSVDSLARKYHLSTKDIAKANGISSESVLVDGHKLIIPDPPKALHKTPTMHKAGVISGDRISIRIGPNESYRRATMVDQGAPVVVTASAGDWVQVSLTDGKTGWVLNNFVSDHGVKKAVSAQASNGKRKHVVKDDEDKPSTRKTHHKRQIVAAHKAKNAHRTRVASAKSASHKTHKHHSNGGSDDSRSDVVRTAYAYRGTPYHFGASGRTAFDCSGFTSYVYRHKGVSLPHSAAGQFEHGKRVAKSELKPGDLVFFHTTRGGISHVGIYAGSGKFVHASSAGGRVRVDSLQSGYYKERFRGARRVK